MSEITKRLRDRRMNVWEQAKGLADTAAEENRAFSAEEQGTWDALNEELNKLDTRIKSAIETEQRGKDADAAFAKLEGKPVERGAGGEQRGTDLEQEASELRAWMRGNGGRFYEVKPTGPVQSRAALKVGTLTSGAYSGSGGATVPVTFYDRLIQHMIQNAAIMQAGVTVLNTAGGEVIQVPKTTAHSTAGIVTEGTAIGESEPTFGQVSLGAYKYGTLIQISRELLDDTGVDLEGYLAMQAGRALGNAFGAHAITGSGTSQPRGVVTDATSGFGSPPADGTFAPTYEDIIDLYHSVIAPYRASQSCHWMLNDTTVGVLRKLRSESGGAGTTTGLPIWQPSMQAGSPDLLLGKPILTDPNVAAVAANAKSVLFGDFSTYFVRLAGGVRFERSDDYHFDTDLVTFRALMRADGALVDLTGAVKYFAGGDVEGT